MEKFELFKQIKNALSALSQQEVKTPLSFFFRVVFYLSVMVIVAIVWGRPEMQRLVFLTGVGVIGLVVLAVIVFGWYKPKNLTYGETGHRAEAKLAFGTEKRELTSAEISSLPGSGKPLELPTGGESS
ncbi:MAG: hypothetical protein WB763_04985 [Terriglobia bacterium]|jgi:hypothetical protein